MVLWSGGDRCLLSSDWSVVSETSSFFRLKDVIVTPVIFINWRLYRLVIDDADLVIPLLGCLSRVAIGFRLVNCRVVISYEAKSAVRLSWVILR